MMEITLKDLELSWSRVESVVERFIARSVKSAGVRGVVVGLSGGVDSSTAAALAVKALGAERVLGLIMPDTRTTPKADVNDALELASSLGIEHYVIEIDKMCDEIATKNPLYDPDDVVAVGNVRARVRMTLLYYAANRRKLMVLGAGDRSEILLGYYTKYGDGGVDILPLGSLFKTQVRKLAKHLGLPSKIAEKPSSPRLWPGQTAEGELGFSYEEADLVLHCLVDRRMKQEKTAKATGVDLKTVREIARRIKESSHKRRLPPKPPLREILKSK